MLLYDRQIVTQNVTKKIKRIGKPIRFIWYTIRGSNDMVGVRNVAKWRFDALPVLTYPGTYPNRN